MLLVFKNFIAQFVCLYEQELKEAIAAVDTWQQPGE
jgi:hypothetical protein